MITEHDLQEAILECEGQRNPTSSTCLKLAALYTIKDKMFPEEQKAVASIEPQLPMPNYSYAPPVYTSDTEFMKAVSRMDIDDVLPVMDELMTTLKAMIPRLYEGAMRRLTNK